MRDFFKEANGQYSCMRLISFIVIVTVLLNWTIMNFKSGQLISFDWQELMLIITPFVGKTVSKFGE